MTLTVFFEEPFWTGFLERQEGDRLSVAKVVFGAEPSDAQVLEWVLSDYYALRFSPPVTGVKQVRAASNPKRRQRQAAQAQSTLIGTKSQQAMSLAREGMKLERKVLTKQQREAEEQRKLELRVAKKKAKHRGH